MKYRLRGAALYVLQGRWAEWAFRRHRLAVGRFGG